MWYYTQNNQQVGPVDEAKIKELVASGVVNANTMVWTAGMASWRLSARLLWLAWLAICPLRPPLMQ